MAGGLLTGTGVWGTPGNWSDGAAIPVSTSNAIIPNTLGADVTDAGNTANDIDLALLYIHKGFVHSFGAAGSPILTGAVLVKLFSSGPCFLECDAGAAAIDINNAYVALARPDVVCELGSGADPGEWDNISILRGNVTLKANISLNATAVVEVGYVHNSRSDAQVTMAAGGPTLATLRQYGGRVVSNKVITNAHVMDGTLVKKTTYASNVWIYPGGVVEYEDAAEAADNVIIRVYAGGLLDLSTNANLKAFDDVYLYPGAMVRHDENLHTWTGTAGWVDLRNEVL